MKQKVNKQSFSMFEVLVVIAVLSILASLIFRSIGIAREEAKRTTCLNNLKQIEMIAAAYKKDHRKVPAALSLGDLTFASSYVDDNTLEIFLCPGDYGSDMSSLSDLMEGSSYYYIPSAELAALMTDVGDALDEFLVIYDKSKGFHNGKFNILYLHGSPKNKGGIAETYSEDDIPNIPFNDPDDTKGYNPGLGNNHGHGNNKDSVDSSNPGSSPKHQDDINVDEDGNIYDDEKRNSGNATVR